MKRLIHTLFPILSLVFFVYLTIFAGDAAKGAQRGLALSFQTAVPALFPFFVAGSLLTRSGLVRLLGRAMMRPVRFLYGLSGNCAAAVVIGLSGGYPVGAQAACDLYRNGLAGKEETERLLGFCNNSGPAFIIGVAGVGVCGSVRTGLTLYLIHALSALLTGVLLTRRQAAPARPLRAGQPKAKAEPFAAALVGAVKDSFMTCITVSAFITFFSVLLAIFSASGVLDALSSLLAPLLLLLGFSPQAGGALVTGFFELTGGLALLPELRLSPRLLLPLISFLLGFGGLSVHCQSLSIIGQSGLSPRYHFAGKAVHGALAAFLAMLLCRLRPHSVAVFSPSPSLLPVYSPVFSISLIVLCIVLIIFTKSCGKHRKNGL